MPRGGCWRALSVLQHVVVHGVVPGMLPTVRSGAPGEASSRHHLGAVLPCKSTFGVHVDEMGCLIAGGCSSHDGGRTHWDAAQQAMSQRATAQQAATRWAKTRWAKTQRATAQRMAMQQAMAAQMAAQT